MKRLLVLGLLLVAGAARPATGHAQEIQDRVIRALKWKGNKHITTTTLENSIATTNSSWFARQAPFSWLGFLGEKRYLNETDLERDVLRVGVLYKLSGFPDPATRKPAPDLDADRERILKSL